MPISRQKLDSVQVLRAIAVMLVVYVHTIYSSVDLIGRSSQSTFHHLFHWGAIGVDLFFAISGFIMTRILHTYRQTDGWKTFALKRVIRIIPLYWGLSLGAALIIWRTYPLKASVFRQILTFIPVFETKLVFPIIPAGWSLAYELYFYALIVVALATGLKRLQTSLFIGLVLLSLAGFFVHTMALFPRFLTSPLLLEFALGIGVGMLYDRFQPTNPGHRAGMVVALMVGLFFIVSPLFLGFNHRMAQAEYVITSNPLALWRSITWGIPCALLLLGFVLLERVYSLRMPTALVLIGNASYSNYLLHGLVLIFGRRTIMKLQLSADGYIVFQVVLCTVLSLILYRLVEKPLTDRLNRYVFPPKPVVEKTRHQSLSNN